MSACRSLTSERPPCDSVAVGVTGDRAGLAAYKHTGGRERDLVAVVGEVGAQQYLRLLTVMSWDVLLLLPGLALVFFGVWFQHAYMLVLAAFFIVAGVCVYGYAYAPISKTVSQIVGRSPWWCANQLPTGSARFVLWVESLTVEPGASNVLVADPDRDAALRAGLRSRPPRLAGRVVVLILGIAGMAAYGLRGQSMLNNNGAATSTPSVSQILGSTGLAGTLNPVSLLTCSNPTQSLVPAPLAEGGDAFRCTAANGGTVTYGLFASEAQAQTWATAECRREHLPAKDAYTSQGTAVVTSDESVLATLQAAGN